MNGCVKTRIQYSLCAHETSPLQSSQLKRGLWPEMEICETSLRQCGGLFLPTGGLIAALGASAPELPIHVGIATAGLRGVHLQTTTDGWKLTSGSLPSTATPLPHFLRIGCATIALTARALDDRSQLRAPRTGVCIFRRQNLSEHLSRLAGRVVVNKIGGRRVTFLWHASSGYMGNGATGPAAICH
jgi:hypothetical protein